MSDKVQEEVFKGIHFIRISNLPKEQQEYFKSWLPKDQCIKILIEGEIISDCVQSHHYSHWYEHVLPTQLQAKAEAGKVEGEKPIFNLSFLRSADSGA